MNTKNLDTLEPDVRQPDMRTCWQTPRLTIVLSRQAAQLPSANPDGDVGS